MRPALKYMALVMVLGCLPTEPDTTRVYVENRTQEALDIAFGTALRPLLPLQRTHFEVEPGCYMVRAYRAELLVGEQEVCPKDRPALVIWI